MEQSPLKKKISPLTLSTLLYRTIYIVLLYMCESWTLNKLVERKWMPHSCGLYVPVKVYIKETEERLAKDSTELNRVVQNRRQWRRMIRRFQHVSLD